MKLPLFPQRRAVPRLPPGPADLRGALPGHDQPLHEAGHRFRRGDHRRRAGGRRSAEPPGDGRLRGLGPRLAAAPERPAGHPRGGRSAFPGAVGGGPGQASVGEIEWFEDLPEQPLTYEHNDLAALLSVLAEHPMVAALEMGGEPGGQQDLANQLAYLLPFDTERKLELLALTRRCNWRGSRCCWSTCRASWVSTERQPSQRPVARNGFRQASRRRSPGSPRRPATAATRPVAAAPAATRGAGSATGWRRRP